MTAFPFTETVTREFRLTRIRNIAEGISSQAKPDSEILDIMDRMDGTVMESSKKHDWVGTENSFVTAVTASNCLIASEILDEVPGREAKSKDLLDKAKFYLRILNNKDTENQSASMIDPVSSGVNVTNELDPDVYTQDQDVFTN